MNTVWTDLYQTNFKLNYYDVNGIKTRCLEAGEGEPIIFLHGTGGHLETFCRNITEHAKYFKVYAIDMIGHGFTDKPIEYDYTIPVYTKHLLDFMDTVGIDKASIAGESLGGWVAAQFAYDHPDRINKIVLITSGGLHIDLEMMERFKRVTLEAVANPNYESVRKRLELLMKEPDRVTEEMVQIRYSIYQLPNMLEAMKRIMCLQDLECRKQNLLTEEVLRAIKAPVCIIWSSHDLSGIEVGEQFAKLIPNSKYHLMDDCGHWPHFEKAEEFNTIQIDFLKSSILQEH